VIEDQGLRWKLILNGTSLRVVRPQGARLPEIWDTWKTNPRSDD